jgi:enoyl-CoA hydratase
VAYENLIVTDRGQTRIITINRPDVLNALNKKTLFELERALSEAEQCVDTRALVLTGAGEKSFVAGADIAEMKSLTPAEAEEFSRLGHRVMDSIEEIRVPVIAAVNGFALGGGLELALACDFIYASANARLGLPETSLGLIPGFGGTTRLGRRFFNDPATTEIYTARQLKAEEAQAAGLVNRVVPEGELTDEVVKVAEKMAKNGPYAIALCKRMLLENMDADHSTANLLEQHSFGLVFGSKDHEEGIAAFLDKRKPSFEGR